MKCGTRQDTGGGPRNPALRSTNPDGWSAALLLVERPFEIRHGDSGVVLYEP